MQHADVLVRAASDGVGSEAIEEQLAALNEVARRSWGRVLVLERDELVERLVHPEDPGAAVVEGLAECGAASLGSGPPKMWKTTLGVSAGLSVASGVSFAGRFKTEQRPFLHVDGEMGQRRALTLWRCLARGEGIDVVRLARDGLLNYLNATRPGPAREPRAWVQLVRERGVGLVLMDPTIAFFVGDENAAPEVRAWWSAAVRPLLDEGAAVMVLHHTRKGSPLLADSAADSARGSGDWRGAPDLHFGLKCEPGDRRLLRVEVTGSRLGPEPPPFFLRVEDHEGGKRLRWAGEAQEAIGKTAAAADAIEAMTERAGDGGVPRKVILETLSPRFAERTVEDALSLVRERRSVEARRVGREMVYRRVQP
jgi:hypothetical protein